MGKQRSAPGELERVRRFVNTRQVRAGTDLLSDTAGMAGWFADEGLAPAGLRVTRTDLARAVELREALRATLATHHAGGSTPPHNAGGSRRPDSAGSAPAFASRTLDEAARRARLRLRFDDDGNASLAPEAAGVSGALGRLLAIVHDAIVQGTWSRLKVCREHDCEWAFYDHTKNHSGAWCSMERCGNRAKARAFRERHTSPAGERHASPAGGRHAPPAGDPATAGS